MDVTNQTQIDKTFDFVYKDLKKCGHQLWSIVNNAGICYTGLLEWGTFDDCFKLFDINVFGAIRVTRKFIPLLRQSKGLIVSNMKYFILFKIEN